MAKKTKTIMTFGVRIILPLNANGAMIQAYLREAIISCKDFIASDSPLQSLQSEDFTITLQRKETTYG